MATIHRSDANRRQTRAHAASSPWRRSSWCPAWRRRSAVPRSLGVAYFRTRRGTRRLVRTQTGRVKDSKLARVVTDAALLDRLASEKLERKAKQIAAQGWKWIEVRARYSFDEFVSYGELRKSRREPSEEEAAAIERIESRIAELHPQMEALVDQGDDDEQGDQVFLQLEAEEETLQMKLKALLESFCVWPVELMAQAGCVLFVGSKGTAEVKFGLIRPDDRASMAEAAKQARPTDGPDDALVSLPSGKSRPVHSDKLMRRLTAHRVLSH